VSDAPDIRASDADRERAATEIREHFAAGRLSADELSERMQAVYEAGTAGELGDLRADLPALPAAPAEQRAAFVERRAELQRRLLQETGGGLVLFAICTAIWLGAGATGTFWPVWVGLVAVLPILRSGWRLYGPAPELDRVEDDLARRRDRSDRNERRNDRRRRR
jgi:Domain of unknown function (DUF1707)